MFSLVERAGQVRSFHVNDVTAGTLRWKLAENVSYTATLMTARYVCCVPAGGKRLTYRWTDAEA